MVLIIKLALVSLLDEATVVIIGLTHELAGIVRAAVQQGRTSDTQAAYWGPMFRYERPQRGRYRQFLQCGVEAIGHAAASGPESDADVLGAAWAFLRGLGWHERGVVPTVLLNSLGDHASRAAYRTALAAFLHGHQGELSKLSQDRLARGAVLRVLDSKAPEDQPVVAAAPKAVDHLGKHSSSRFLRLQRLLQALDIPVKLDPRLVRGLDYYCETVFEIVVESINHPSTETDGTGQLGTVLAGGRYDGILGSSLPGIGWAAGVDRLAHIHQQLEEEALNEALQAEGAMSLPWAPLRQTALVDVIVVRSSGQASTDHDTSTALGSHACVIAARLRRGLARAGRTDIRVRLRTDVRKLRKQLAASHQAKADRVIMISQGEGVGIRTELKDMVSGQQYVLPDDHDPACCLLATPLCVQSLMSKS